MQQVNQLISKAESQDFQPSSEQVSRTKPTCDSSKSALSAKDEAKMAMLWDVFTHQLGAKFSNQYGPAGGVAFLSWAKTLKSIDAATLREAFRAFLQSDEKFFDLHTYRHFIVEVKSKNMGLPDLDGAWSLVQKKRFDELHPAFHRIVAPRMFDLKFASTEKSEKLFKKLYNEVVQRVLSGEVFVRPVELPAPPKKEFGKDQGRATIRDLIKEMKG